MRNAAALLWALLLTLPPLAAEARRSRDSPFDPPTIVSREEWGADESLGMIREEGTEEKREKPPATPSEEKAPAEPSEREVLCREILQTYKEEFRYRLTLREAPGGERYLWPRQYSREVKLFVIHHTGENENPEREQELTGTEHVRAIYQWHTAHNGWGDVGYHYLIDKEGVIYEGRAGGKGVVGAHTYCANTGTIGIALLGNFEYEDPTEEQLRSARWLLASLSEEYDIDPRGRTLFHGKLVPTIVSHRDVSLNKTACAGDSVQELLPALRRLVALQDFTTVMIIQEKLPEKHYVMRQTKALLPRGSTHLRLPPRGAAKVELTYQAPKDVGAGSRIANVVRSNKDIALWQMRAGNRFRVRDALTTERALERNEKLPIHLTVLAPEETGTYTFRIGNSTYTLDVAGRRLRTQE